MRKGLSILLGMMLCFGLTVEAAFAMEATEQMKVCKLAPPGHILSLLNDVRMQGVESDPVSEPGFALNQELIGDDLRSEPSEATDIDIEAKDDLAAVSIKTTGTVTPYVGAGITTGEEIAEAPGVDAIEAAQEAERQSYKLGAGFGCELSKTTRLDLGYRYSKENFTLLPGTGTGATTDPATDDHHISIGLQFDF